MSEPDARRKLTLVISDAGPNALRPLGLEENGIGKEDPLRAVVVIMIIQSGSV